MGTQAKDLISMIIPVSTARGLLVSGAGTLSAVLKAVGVVYEGTDATETYGQVQIGGIVMVTLAATLTAGALCVSNAVGKASAFTEDTDAVDGNNHLVCVILLEGGDSGELVRAKLV